MELKRDIKGDGPLGGLLVLGDYAREGDVERNKPFSNKSGYVLKKLVAQEGFTEVRYENVVERINNYQSLKNLYLNGDVGGLPGEELRQWFDDVVKRVRAVKPKVVLCCGDMALRALTHHTNLNDVHCYVLNDSLKVRCPIVPAYHPSALMKEEGRWFWLRWALRKTHDVYKGHKDKEPKYIISNDYDESLSYLKQAQLQPEVSVDIETINFNHFKLNGEGATKLDSIRSYAVSVGEDIAVSVSKDGMDRARWCALLNQLRLILADTNIRKIGQNFMPFDAFVLWKTLGFRVHGSVWDTRWAGNLLYPDLKQKLADHARIYLYESPWKGGYNETDQKLRLYNARDALYTHRIKNAQEKLLEERGLLAYFEKYVIELDQYAHRMMLRGCRIDTDLKSKYGDTGKEALEPIKNEMAEIAKPFLAPGEKKKKARDQANDSAVELPDGMTIRKGMKRNELNTLLMVRLGLPQKECKEYYVAKAKETKLYGLTEGSLYKKAYKTEISLVDREYNPSSPLQTSNVLKNMGISGVQSTDKESLIRLSLSTKTPDEAKVFLAKLQNYREGTKFITSYCNATIDDDNRWRFCYNIGGTTSGRSSSNKTPWGTGGNSQNIPRAGYLGMKFRNVFVADEGKQLVQVDLARAEAFVVAWISQDEELERLLSNGTDIHCYTASKIFNIEYQEIMENKSKEPYKTQRYLGKMANHALNYGLGAKKFAAACLKNTGGKLVISVAEAQKIRDGYFKAYPKILTNFHEGIKEQIKFDRTLTSPHGRQYMFFGPLKVQGYHGYGDNEELFRHAYSFIPQATVVDTTNLAWMELERRKIKSMEVLQQCHDSLLMQIDEDKVDVLLDTIDDVYKGLEFHMNDKMRLIPWDKATGKRWGEVQDV